MSKAKKSYINIFTTNLTSICKVE